jgi:hypothetical protein
MSKVGLETRDLLHEAVGGSAIQAPRRTLCMLCMLCMQNHEWNARSCISIFY